MPLHDLDAFNCLLSGVYLLRLMFSDIVASGHHWCVPKSVKLGLAPSNFLLQWTVEEKLGWRQTEFRAPDETRFGAILCHMLFLVFIGARASHQAPRFDF